MAYKVKQLLDKGLDLSSLDKDLRDDIETIKFLSSDFSKDDSDAMQLDALVYEQAKSFVKSDEKKPDEPSPSKGKRGRPKGSVKSAPKKKGKRGRPAKQEKAPAKPKVKYKTEPKSDGSVPDCDELLKRWRERRQKAKDMGKKRRTKPVFTKISEGVVSAVEKAIKNVPKADIKAQPVRTVKKFEVLRDAADKFLKAFKSVLGEDYIKTEAEKELSDLEGLISTLQEKYVKKYGDGGMMNAEGDEEDMPVIRTQFEEDDYEYAKGGGVGGEQITMVAEAIFSPNEKNGKIKISTKAPQSLGGLKYLIADLNSEYIASAIFEENQVNGKIETTFGEKTYGQLLAMISQAKANRLDFVKHAGGGGVGDVPNTVAEFNSKMNSFTKRMNVAEGLWKLDNGKAYNDIISERDAYYQKTKDAWYSTLNEEEKRGNKARYNIIRKMINEAFGFEKGGGVGSIPNNYEGKSSKKVWESWTATQKAHFLRDHFYTTGKKLPTGNIYAMNWDELPMYMKNEISNHVYAGQYATGGGVGKNKPMFKKGDKVRISSDNDNENYDDFRGKILTITNVATNEQGHRGYDSSMEGMALYDFKNVPFSLYEYEIEPA